MVKTFKEQIEEIKKFKICEKHIELPKDLYGCYIYALNTSKQQQNKRIFEEKMKTWFNKVRLIFNNG